MNATIFTARPRPEIHFNVHIYRNTECLPLILTGHISDRVDKLSLQTDKKNVLDVDAVKKYVTGLPNDESVRKMIDGDITDCYDYSVSHWLFLLPNSPNVKHAHYSQFKSIHLNGYRKWYPNVW
jgi:hypothetical protein